MAKTKSVTSDVLKLPDTRLSFSRLWSPKAFQPGQTPRFEATFLFDPAKPINVATLKEILSTAGKIGKEAFGVVPREVREVTSKIFPAVAFDPKTPADGVKFQCLVDGNTKSYDGYAGMWSLATHNKNRPLIGNASGGVVVEGESQAPYSGCYVQGKITLWTQDNEFGKRINASLRSVQFLRAGTAFGAQAPDPDEEFEALEDGPATADETMFS